MPEMAERTSRLNGRERVDAGVSGVLVELGTRDYYHEGVRVAKQGSTELFGQITGLFAQRYHSCRFLYRCSYRRLLG